MHKPLTVAEKERLAELVAANTPLAEICEVIGRDRWTTRRNINYLARRPAPERTRSPLRLSLAEREEISRGVAAGESLRSIARRLGRSPSTVSREVAGNGGARRYRAVVADRAALKRARRPKPAKLAVHPELCALVESKLELRWSPQQISGWLSETFPDRPEMQVSHETIYLSLFVQSRGALRKELTRYLRRGQATRRPRGRRAYDGGRGKIRAMVHISERPAEAEDRAVPGHWKGDLVFGTARSAVATLVERHSRFVMLVGSPTATPPTWSRTRSRRRSPSFPNGSEDRSPGTRARRWPATNASAWRPVCPSTSVTRTAPGSAARTRTPTVFSASTSQSAHHSRSTRPRSTPSPMSSTDALDKPSAGRHHHKCSTRRCVDPLRPRENCVRQRSCDGGQLGLRRQRHHGHIELHPLVPIVVEHHDGEFALTAAAGRAVAGHPSDGDRRTDRRNRAQHRRVRQRLPRAVDAAQCCLTVT